MMVKNVKHEQLEDKTFRFYHIMWYPIPINKDVFAYHCNKDFDVLDLDFSWHSKSELMKSYIKYIDKWWWLYRNLPFVKEVYLANSITFNSLCSDSDIDLFVVSKNWRVWTSRLLASFLMMLFWIKRTKNLFKKKFCLSFFIDEKLLDLQKISLWDNDIYLPYWIAHLVPLYLESGQAKVYKENAWIKSFFPNIQLKQNIVLWNKCYSWNWLFKKCVEFILWWSFWDSVEKIIQKKWWNRMKKIVEKNVDDHRWVVFEKWMLKFYKDMRKYYSDLFFSSDN